MISQRAEIHPNAKIGKNVTVYPFAYIEEDVEIGDNCVIFPYVSIMRGTRLGANNKVYQNTVLGAEPQDFHFKGEPSQLVIGDDNVFRENVVINRATHSTGKTVIGNKNFFMEGVHVSHDTKIGNENVFGYGTKIAGDCLIESHVIFSSSVIANPNTRVGSVAMIQSGSRFSQDVPPYVVVGGNPVQFSAVNKPILKAMGMDERVLSHIANAYRLVFQGKTSVFDAVNQVEEQVPDGEAIRALIKFIRATKLGLVGK